MCSLAQIACNLRQIYRFPQKDRTKLSQVKMEKVEFTKYHGIGNDFVLIDCCHETRNESLAGGRLLSPEQCIRLCDRHRGIGADGVIFVQDDLPVSNGSEFVMVIINSDGSRAKMCGNGLRCFAKYLHSKLQSEPVSRSFRIWTDSGERIAEVGADGQVSVDMGVPQLRAHLIPTLLAANSGLACVNVDLQQPNLQVTCVNMGNPHAVAIALKYKRAKEAAYIYTYIYIHMHTHFITLDVDLFCSMQTHTHTKVGHF